MSQRGSTAAAAGAWGALIEAGPVPNRAARVVGTEADGTLTLAVPTRKPPAWQRAFAWLIRVPAERLTVLDPVGAAIWKSCDGRHTVEEIVEKFAAQHHLSFHESRVSVTGYLTSLLRRGILAVAVDPTV